MVAIHLTKAKVIALAIPLLLGQIVGGIQGDDTLTWFKILKKPFWTPPILAFPIVWTVLYLFMGWSSYIVWTHGGFEAQGSVLLVYAFQLFLNLLWPVIFFKAKRIKLAQLENLALLVFASLTANSFYRVERLAGQLMWPYIAWLVLANLLNFSIARKNPDGPDSPKLQDNYHPQDKRNPGEQGNYSSNPTTASLSTKTAPSHRNRKSLVVFGCMGPSMQKPSMPVRRANPRASARASVRPVMRTAASQSSRLAVL